MQTKRSVIRNTALSYAGQAYTLLVGILIMPFYLGHMGAEAYGLIGFFSVLQAWLQLLDAGLSPSLVRAVAHQQAAETQEYLSGRLLRSFEIIFLPLASLCCVAMHAGSEWIAVHWLNAKELSTETLVECIGLMGIVIALRLYSTLYKSGIQGLEQHAWLNIANVIIATLRYFGGLFLVSTISSDPVLFFEFQVLVGLVEALIFAARAYQQMPTPTWLTGFNWQLVKPIIPFAASMSGTAVLWIVLTQIDKVLLSELLPLNEYGYFSLVALITTGIMMLSNPLAQTLLPRLTVLMAEGRRDDMHALFLAANRFVCTFLFPLAALIALHAHEMVYAWSGDRPAAALSPDQDVARLAARLPFTQARRVQGAARGRPQGGAGADQADGKAGRPRRRLRAVPGRPRVHRFRGPAGGHHRFPPPPRRDGCHAAARTCAAARAPRRGTPGRRAGGHRGPHQRRRDLPIRRGPRRRRRPRLPALRGPAVPPQRPGQHGNGVPGAVGAAGELAGGPAGAPGPGLHRSGHGAHRRRRGPR